MRLGRRGTTQLDPQPYAADSRGVTSTFFWAVRILGTAAVLAISLALGWDLVAAVATLLFVAFAIEGFLRLVSP